jgi:hypothetical protein
MAVSTLDGDQGARVMLGQHLASEEEPMARMPDPDAPAGPGGGVAGAVLLAIGAALLLVVLAADVGGSAVLEALAFDLGLAWGPLLQAVGLSLALTGAWLLWRSRRR